MYRKYLNILFSVNGRCRWNENLTQCYSIASSPARTSSLGHFSCAFLFISQPFLHIVTVFHSVFFKNCNVVAKFYLSFLRFLVRANCMSQDGHVKITS